VGTVSTTDTPTIWNGWPSGDAPMMIVCGGLVSPTGRVPKSATYGSAVSWSSPALRLAPVSLVTVDPSDVVTMIEPWKIWPGSV